MRRSRSRSRLGDEAWFAGLVLGALLISHYRFRLPPLDQPGLWPWWTWVGAAALVIALTCALVRLVWAILHRIPYRERIFRSRAKGQEWGWVYVLSNPAMPGVFKVGSTAGSPGDRARELHTTGVAAPFVVAWSVHCAFARRVEIQAHRLLNGSRVSPDREFFRAEVGAIKRAIREAQAHVTAAKPQG
jgi:hypothetical protein